MKYKYPLEALGKYVSVQGGFAFKSRDFQTFGVPVLKIKNVRLREVDTSEVDYVDEEVARSNSNYFCKHGDLLISMTGSGPQAPNSVVGRVARFTGKDNKFLLNQRVGRFIIKNKEKVDARYLFYVLTQRECQWELVSIATGSANQANISVKQIERLGIPLPPLDEQKAIAHILGTLDDKIELNQQMNRTLEGIARAIFKSWFIDFDPVRAKMDGRQPAGMDAETAALFPDEFEDSPLGQIPKGWTVAPLDQIADFLNGLALQKYPPDGDNYLPVIKIAELRKGITESSGKASHNIDEKYIIYDGEVLFSWSGSLEAVIWCGGKGALNQHLFKVTSKKYPKWFYYEWVKFHLPDFQAIAASKATTMGHIQRHHLTAALVVIPPDNFIKSAGKRMAPLLERLIINHLESRTISSIRDTLLSKLLSGEVRVKDVEKLLVEEGNE